MPVPVRVTVCWPALCVSALSATVTSLTVPTVVGVTPRASVGDGYPLPLPFSVKFLIFSGLGGSIWAKFLILFVPSPNFRN